MQERGEYHPPNNPLHNTSTSTSTTYTMKDPPADVAVVVAVPASYTEVSDAKQQERSSNMSKWCQKLLEIYEEYEILVLFIVVIVLAKAYPKLGAEYLAPHITATWIAVVFIFRKYLLPVLHASCYNVLVRYYYKYDSTNMRHLEIYICYSRKANAHKVHHILSMPVVAGLALKTEEFESASKEIHFIVFIQTFNFGVVSLLVFGLSRVLVYTGVLVESLADGMVICACLPLSVNMVLILTKTAGGDEAAAILNSTFANLVGVFLSPLMILGYLGVTGGVDLGDVFYKLAIRIVFPLLVGQMIHKTSTTTVQLMKTYARIVKKSQIYALVFILYTVFCTTFIHGTSVPMSSIVLAMFVQMLLLCALTSLAWFALQVYFPDKPKLRVMGLFGCTHKTVSVGVPLINAMYEGNPNVGLYTLPLLMWHPLQLVVGSILAPRLYRFVESEEKRLRTLPTSNASVVEVVNFITTPHDDQPPVNEHTPLVSHGIQATTETTTTTTTYV